jgi:hypothetical protein
MQRIKDFLDRRIAECQTELEALRQQEPEYDLKATVISFDIDRVVSIQLELERVKQEVWACENDMVIPSRTSTLKS